jgi:hypothetical protein
MKIAILGGYGNTGLRLARILATSGHAGVMLLGRDDARLRAAADRVGREARRQVTWRAADASSGPSLRAALEGASLLVVASSTTAHAATVARTALEAGVDYLDTRLSIRTKHGALEALRPAVEKRGLCFITDGGFHPGVPGATVRYAALRLPSLTTANVGGSFNLPWASVGFSADSQAEFVAELRDMNNSAFSRWRLAPELEEPPELRLRPVAGDALLRSALPERTGRVARPDPVAPGDRLLRRRVRNGRRLSGDAALPAVAPALSPGVPCPLRLEGEVNPP